MSKPNPPSNPPSKPPPSDKKDNKSKIKIDTALTLTTTDKKEPYSTRSKSKIKTLEKKIIEENLIEEKLKAIVDKEEEPVKLAKTNTWSKFLEDLEAKYQPINPKLIDSPKTSTNVDLEITEVSSLDDPDFTPPESSEEDGDNEDEDNTEETLTDDENSADFNSDFFAQFLKTVSSKINQKLSSSSSSSIPMILYVSDKKDKETEESDKETQESDKENDKGTEANEESSSKSNPKKRPATSQLTNDLKKQKMDKLDRDYRSILSHREKDAYDYFAELDLEKKKYIISEERIIRETFCDVEPMRIKVINSSLPRAIKAEVLRKLSSSKCGFEKNAKLGDWIEHIMRVPWGNYFPMPITLSDQSQKIGNYMTSVYHHMDQAVYGHLETKCHIMQIISKWITNPTAVGNCLAIQGPMGVGKTTLVKEGLAPALGRPFNFISLGGATDASFLEGHSFTYEGAIPGQMIEIIQRSKCMNPIIYFDELDKISKSHRGEEIANLLIHITDTQQNDKFHDKYFGNIDIDLSKAFFVFSYNNDHNVPPILKDRLQIVRVKGYNTAEKCKIAIEYMFPRFCKDMGFNKGHLIITNEVINYIITNYAEAEEGVRNLGRCLETLVSRLNVIRLVQDNTQEEKENFFAKLPFKASKIPMITNPFSITKEIIENILIKNKVETFNHMYI